MKILLVVPPFVEEGLEMAGKESIGLCYLASVLRPEGFHVHILDADLLKLNVSQTIDRICRTNPSLIGFSVLEGTIEATVEILRGIRERKVSSHVVFGGYLPTLITEELLTNLREVDSVIRGEGEYTLLELAQCLRSGGDWRPIKGLAYREEDSVMINESRRPPDVDRLPFPARDLLPEVMRGGGVAGVVGSRGCFARCSFCCINQFGKASGTTAWRGRSPSNIVDEMEILKKDRGVETVSFYDSNFIGPGSAGVKRAYEIGTEIIRRKLKLSFAVSTRPDQIDRDLFKFLKQAGLMEVFIGLESMSQKSLDLYRKETTVEQNREAIRVLEDLGIAFRPGFILYEPYITLEQIRENIRHLRSLLKGRCCNKFHFFKGLRVYRGSPMETLFRERGILIRNGWHATYRWQDPSVREFIRLTGMVSPKMLPLLQRSRELDPEGQRSLDHLLGTWSLDIHEKVLEMLQSRDRRQTAFIDIVVESERQLKRIEKMCDRYSDSGRLFEGRKQKCSAA